MTTPRNRYWIALSLAILVWAAVTVVRAQEPTGTLQLGTVQIDATHIAWDAQVAPADSTPYSIDFSLDLDTGVLTHGGQKTQLGPMTATVLFDELGHLAELLSSLSADEVMKDAERQ